MTCLLVLIATLFTGGCASLNSSIQMLGGTSEQSPATDSNSSGSPESTATTEQLPSSVEELPLPTPMATGAPALEPPAPPIVEAEGPGEPAPTQERDRAHAADTPPIYQGSYENTPATVPQPMSAACASGLVGGDLPGSRPPGQSIGVSAVPTVMPPQVHLHGSQFGQPAPTATEQLLTLETEYQQLHQQHMADLVAIGQLQASLHQEVERSGLLTTKLQNAERENAQLRERVAQLLVQLEQSAGRLKQVEDQANATLRRIESELDSVLLDSVRNTLDK